MCDLDKFRPNPKWIILPKLGFFLSGFCLFHLYFQVNLQYWLSDSSLSYLRGTKTYPMPPMAGFTDPVSLKILSIINVLTAISKNLNPAAAGMIAFPKNMDF